MSNKQQKSLWSKPTTYFIIILSLFLFVFLITRLIFLWGIPWSKIGIINALFGSGDIKVEIWLGFWGSLLSFIGTIILGAIAVYQNVKANEMNKSLLSIETRRDAMENLPEIFIYDKTSHFNPMITVNDFDKRIEWAKESIRPAGSVEYMQKQRDDAYKLYQYYNSIRDDIKFVNNIAEKDRAIIVTNGIGLFDTNEPTEEYDGTIVHLYFYFCNFSKYKIKTIEDIKITISFPQEFELDSVSIDLVTLPSNLIGNSFVDRTFEKKAESMKSVWNDNRYILFILVPRSCKLKKALVDKSFNILFTANIKTHLDLSYELSCELQPEDVSICIISPIL